MQLLVKKMTLEVEQRPPLAGTVTNGLIYSPWKILIAEKEEAPIQVWELQDDLSQTQAAQKGATASKESYPIVRCGQDGQPVESVELDFNPARNEIIYQRSLVHMGRFVQDG